MPRLVAAANGNFTDPIWAVCDTPSGLDADGSGTAVSTTPQDSSAFVPSAGTVDAVLLKLLVRTITPAAQQLIVVLRNVTTATNVATVTVNVSDLPVTEGGAYLAAGGWMQFVLPAPVTPNGTDQYLIRLSVSAASSGLQFYYSGTAANWARYLRTTATRAPAAGDQFIIAAEKTAPGVAVARAVTMDNATTTQFGTTTGLSTANVNNAGMCVCQGGTLTWANGAGTNYCLRMAGSCVIYGGGTMTMGIVGAEIPRTSTAILEFVTVLVGDSGLDVRRGGVYRAAGQSRTAGKDVVWTLLTANVAAGQPNATVLDDTGWLAGDVFGVAPTTQTYNEAEMRTLASNAGPTSLVATTNYGAAHGGTNEVVAEVGLLTRNVKVRAAGAAVSQGTYVFSDGGAVFDARWVEFFNMGANAVNRFGFVSPVGTASGGSVELRSCAFWQFDNMYCLYFNASDSEFYTLDRNVIYRTAPGYATLWVSAPATTAGKNWAITNNIIPKGPGVGMDLGNLRGALNGNRVAGCAGLGIRVGSNGYPAPANVSAYNLAAFHSNHVHSCIGGLTTSGIFDGGSFGTPLLPFATLWRNGSAGWSHSDTTDSFTLRGTTVYGLKAWGNAGGNISPSSGWLDVTLRNCELSGDTAFAVSYGFSGVSAGYSHLGVRWENCRFGVAGSGKAAHTVADIKGVGATQQRHTFVDCVSGSVLLFNQDGTSPLGSEFREMRRNGVAGAHRTTLSKRGVRQRNTAIKHGTEPDSEQLTPSYLYAQLPSAPRRVAVRAGTTVTVSVWVLKDAAYSDPATPTLVLKSNPALGVDDDLTLMALNVAAVNVWTQLSGTTPAATDDGVVEFVVFTQGTAGNVYVGQWTVS
jgi:hypothetical protein